MLADWRVRFLTLMTLALMALPQWAFAGDNPIDISGEIRVRPEVRSAVNFVNGSTQTYTDQRVRLNFATSLEGNIKVLVVMQDSRRFGSTSSTITTAADPTVTSTTTCTSLAATPGTPSCTTASTAGGGTESVDIYQANVTVGNLGGMPLEFKVGRQVLVYGDQRLIGHLGWNNNGRTFDGYKFSYKAEIGQIDYFTMKVKETTVGTAAGGGDEDLSGLYTQWKFGQAQALDIYYLLWNNETGRDMSTYGARLAGKVDAIDYTAEYALQGGTWTITSGTKINQSANALAVTLGYTMDLWGGTRLGVEYDQGSGDSDSTDTTHKTFVFPFHTNHMYYGYMDYFSWSNMRDIALSLKTKPGEGKTTVMVAYHMLSLDQPGDSWYTVTGNGSSTVVAGTAAAGSKDAGSEIDITAIYPYSKNLKLTAGYSTYSVGQAAKDRLATAANSTWGYGMMELNF